MPGDRSAGALEVKAEASKPKPPFIPIFSLVPGVIKIEEASTVVGSDPDGH